MNELRFPGSTSVCGALNGPSLQRKFTLERMEKSAAMVRADRSNGPALSDRIEAKSDRAIIDDVLARIKQTAAGGGFRGKFGRQIFQATKLCQSVLKPNLVTNKVEFLLFGVWRGFVGLRGNFEVQGDGQDTVKVRFEPPRLSFGNLIDLPIGPKSSVVLTNTYLTPNVRIGKGSRGSLFVFTKGGLADDAGMDRVGLGQTKLLGWLLIGTFVVLLAVLTKALWSSNIVLKGFTILPVLMLAFITQACIRALLSPREQE